MMRLTGPTTDGYGRAQCAHFVERLTDIPLADWSNVAAGFPDRVAEASEQALKDALTEPTIAFDVWSARDDIETALWRFDCPDGRPYISRKGSRARIKLVTERAALAVLVRVVLGATHFVVCYGGFEGVIPLSSL
jgi:hypothetical protein